jgi:DnaJ-class molecular chaperone
MMEVKGVLRRWKLCPRCSGSGVIRPYKDGGKRKEIYPMCKGVGYTQRDKPIQIGRERVV